MAASSSLPTSNSFGSNGSSSSSHHDTGEPSTKPHRHPNLPPPPPPDRLPPPRGRTQPPQKIKLFKKGRSRKEGPGELEDEDWTLEGAEVLTKSGPSRSSMDMGRPVIQESYGPAGSSLASVPSRESREGKSKTRSLAKKTSQLFSRKDRNGNGDAESYSSQTPSQSSLALPSTSRQGSYSSNGSESTHSGNSARYQFPTLNRPASHTSRLSKQSTGAHGRRPSQDSQVSWPAPRTVRSGSGSTYDSPLDPLPPFSSRQPPTNLSASVPTLSRNNLPVPGPPGPNASIPSRMSSWFSHLIPSSSTAAADSASFEAASPPSPARKSTSAAASFLNAARQRAVDGVRHLLDSEAAPDKCPDTIWVMGVGHPGWRPATPAKSFENLPMDGSENNSRRGSAASSAGPSPPNKSSETALRPAAWPKRKDSQPPTSHPPNKAYGNFFNTSNQSLTLPTDSPSKDDARPNADSPKRKAKQEKEIITWPEQFLDDFKSRVWCTYRSQYAPILSLPTNLLIPSPDAYYNAFPPVDASAAPPARKEETSPTLASKPSSWGWARSAEERGLTSDAGWGCMLRTGQSMLANALINLHLGRDWRLPSTTLPKTIDTPADIKGLESYAEYVRIMSWFLDDPSPLCPFSVHRMALIGKELGKEVGEWFGPSTAAGALKTLANSFPLCGLGVATATDSMIYRSDVYAASNMPSKGWRIPGEPKRNARRPSSSPKMATAWGDKAVLILIGLRLGLDGVNPLYYDSIKALFSFPQSVGIAGGRPSSSYYFVGTQANSLFYLDPHLTRPAIPLEIPPASPSDQQAPAKHHEAPLSSALDVVDVDQLSDSSLDSTSATRRAKRSSKAAKRLSAPGSKLTPPTSPPSAPSRTSAAPDTPTTPLASSRPPDVFDAPLPTDTPATVRSQPLKLELDPALMWYADAYPPSAMRTFHCEKVKKMPYSGLDPSMLLGFLCRNEADFEDFVERVNKLPQRIFTVQDEPPAWDEDDDAGLESVSEPDGEGSDAEAEGDAASQQSLETTTAATTARTGAGGTAFPTSPIRQTGTIRLVQPTPRREDDDDWDPDQSVALTERGGTPNSQSIIVEKPATNMPKTAIFPPSDALGRAAFKASGVVAADGEEGQEQQDGSLGWEKARPSLAVLEGQSRSRLDSWVKPEKEVDEAPNGSSLT